MNSENQRISLLLLHDSLSFFVIQQNLQNFPFVIISSWAYSTASYCPFKMRNSFLKRIQAEIVLYGTSIPSRSSDRPINKHKHPPPTHTHTHTHNYSMELAKKMHNLKQENWFIYLSIHLFINLGSYLFVYLFCHKLFLIYLQP